jgi:hypothetical protein
MCQNDHMPRGTETVTDPKTGRKYTFPAPVEDFVVHKPEFHMSDEEAARALAEPEPDEDPDC